MRIDHAGVGAFVGKRNVAVLQIPKRNQTWVQGVRLTADKDWILNAENTYVETMHSGFYTILPGHLSHVFAGEVLEYPYKGDGGLQNSARKGEKVAEANKNLILRGIVEVLHMTVWRTPFKFTAWYFFYEQECIITVRWFRNFVHSGSLGVKPREFVQPNRNFNFGSQVQVNPSSPILKVSSPVQLNYGSEQCLLRLTG